MGLPFEVSLGGQPPPTLAVMHERNRLKLVVKVPATSANLGPGFDALGLALSFGLEVRIRPSEVDRAIGLEGDPEIPEPAHNLLFRAADAAYRAAGAKRPPLEIETAVALPLSRGLGSSAAAAVAGLVGANALLGGSLGRLQLLALATTLEGHPDNVAPAIFGGITVSAVRSRPRADAAADADAAAAADADAGADADADAGADADTVAFSPIVLHPDLAHRLGLVVVIPEFRLSTAAARAALPPTLPHKDATFNAARAALLVAALTSGRVDLLSEALQDRLHQPFRAALVPGMARAMAAGCKAGAYGVTISGAGPTLLAWCPHGEREAIGQAMADAWDLAADIRVAEIAPGGAEATAW
jgi:homoserine kinase